MNAFSRSWGITKLTFEVMKQDKEMFIFPILGGIFSLLFLIAMIFPVLFVSAASSIGIAYKGESMLLMIFLTYLGLAFIATFFNVCVVYTTKKRFEGGNATFGESLKFAFSKLGLILLWSLLAATIGLILRIIDNFAERLGGIGEIIVRIITSILGAAWAIITIFVVPGMVYHNLTPWKAVKNSVDTLKKTWGESLIRGIGMGMAQFVAIIIGIVIGILLIILAIPLGVWAVVFVALLVAIYFVAVVTFFTVANTVFNTALYAYAHGGKLPKEFSHEILANAFRSKQVQAQQY